MENGHRQVQSEFSCNWAVIKAVALPRTRICGSEGKARKKYPTGVARILSAWNWVVTVLSSSWYDKS